VTAQVRILRSRRRGLNGAGAGDLIGAAAALAALWLWFLAHGRARGGVKRVGLRVTLLALAGVLVAAAAERGLLSRASIGFRLALVPGGGDRYRRLPVPDGFCDACGRMVSKPQGADLSALRRYLPRHGMTARLRQPGDERGWTRAIAAAVRPVPVIRKARARETATSTWRAAFRRAGACGEAAADEVQRLWAEHRRTRSRASAAHSPSRSGTSRRALSCWRATRSGRSRCTMRFGSQLWFGRRVPKGGPRVRSTGARALRLPRAGICPGARDRLERRAQGAPRAPAQVRPGRRRGPPLVRDASTWIGPAPSRIAVRARWRKPFAGGSPEGGDDASEGSTRAPWWR